MTWSVKEDVNKDQGGRGNTGCREEILDAGWERKYWMQKYKEESFIKETRQDWECERCGKRLEPMEKEFMGNSKMGG